MLGTQHIVRNITRPMPRGKLRFQTAQVRTVRMTWGETSDPTEFLYHVTLTFTQRCPDEKPPASRFNYEMTCLSIACLKVGCHERRVSLSAGTIIATTLTI
jgi:hypothetical protein